MGPHFSLLSLWGDPPFLSSPLLDLGRAFGEPWGNIPFCFTFLYMTLANFWKLGGSFPTSALLCLASRGTLGKSFLSSSLSWGSLHLLMFIAILLFTLHLGILPFLSSPLLNLRHKLGEPWGKHSFKHSLLHDSRGNFGNLGEPFISSPIFSVTVGEPCGIPSVSRFFLYLGGTHIFLFLICLG